MKKIRITHYHIYLFGLALLLIGLPLSKFLVGASQFILMGNWVIERKFKTKFNLLFKTKSVLIFISILLIHLIWLINTEDYSTAFHDIKIKLPLFILPIVIATSKKIDFSHLKWLLLIFITSIFISSVVSVAVYLGLTNYIANDIRDISIFISHIRFSLFINLSILILLYFVLSEKVKTFNYEKIIYVAIIFWLITFLFILKSFTGIIVLFILAFIYSIYWSFKRKNLLLRIAFILIIISIPITITLYITDAVNKFYTLEKVDLNNLDTHTKKGNKYYHDINNKQIENGNYLYLYICEKELEREWNKVSSLDYKGEDNKGHKISATIKRYITSKGKRKDADGIKSLNQSDIQLIEDGYSNYIFKNRYGFYPKIYEYIWEIDVYIKGGNPSGHSVTQRIEYLKSAFDIIKDNFWFGVGTGDLQDEFDKQYEKTNSPLTKEWRLRAHNQYVTFWVAFGFVGFLLIMFCLSYPAYKEKKLNDYLFIVFMIISLISMLNEDTLETQAGVTFFALFYSLFVFGREDIKRAE